MERKRKKCFPTLEKIDQQNLLITMLLEVEEYHFEEDNRDSTVWSPNRESKERNFLYILSNVYEFLCYLTPNRNI